MIERIKENGLYLIIFFGLLIFINFIGELFFRFLILGITFESLLYSIFWIAAVFFLSYYFLGRIDKVEPPVVLTLSVIPGLIFCLASFMINDTLGTDNMIEKGYIGVFGSTEKDDYRNEDIAIVVHKTFVFKRSDERVYKELKILENKYVDTYSREFIFWQTAFVNGFNPRYISVFVGTDSFNKKLKLFFTVGPVFIFESFINAVMKSWVFMIIPIIGLFFNFKILRNELEPVEDFLKGKRHRNN